MITGHITLFEARCRERSYTLEEVAACIVARDGGMITVDELHPDYPHAPPAGERPGTELTRLLEWAFVKDKPGCRCRQRAREMDRRGCRWCERNLNTIVGWLREEADRRGLPFVDAAGRAAVRLAISRARRSVESRA